VLEFYSSQFNDGPHCSTLTYTSNQAGIKPHKTQQMEKFDRDLNNTKFYLVVHFLREV